MGIKLYPRQKKSGKGSKSKGNAKKKSGKAKREENKQPKNKSDEISDDELMHGLSKEHEDKLLHEEEKKNKSQKKADNKEEKKEEPKSQKKSDGLRARIDGWKKTYQKYKPYIPTTWRYFKKLLKSIRISVDDVNIRVGREDAHEAAIYYGMVQGAAANILSLMSGIFTVKVKKCDVNCIFTENTVDGEGKISVRLRPSALIAIAVCFGINFLLIRHREGQKNKEIVENKNIVGAQP